MSDFNSQHNRAVWFDIPVRDLDRAILFYSAVLKIAVEKQSFGDLPFGVLDHDQGNGGCLVIDEPAISEKGGILVYFNVDGRIRDAVQVAELHGGRIIEPPHSLGPHGHRALLLDSEGNRIALHSNTDA